MPPSKSAKTISCCLSAAPATLATKPAKHSHPHTFIEAPLPIPAHQPEARPISPIVPSPARAGKEKVQSPTEVGISTNKIHARGPVGLDGLVIHQWKLLGKGQIVADYTGENARNFTHKELR